MRNHSRTHSSRRWPRAGRGTYRQDDDNKISHPVARQCGVRGFFCPVHTTSDVHTRDTREKLAPSRSATARQVLCCPRAGTRWRTFRTQRYSKATSNPRPRHQRRPRHPPPLRLPPQRRRASSSPHHSHLPLSPSPFPRPAPGLHRIESREPGCGHHFVCLRVARTAPARTGDTSDRTPALPSCPCADQASNFKFAAPIDVSTSRSSNTYAGPTGAAPPGTSCKPKLRPLAILARHPPHSSSPADRAQASSLTPPSHPASPPIPLVSPSRGPRPP